MKIRRIYALFFSLLVLLSLSSPALAASGGQEPDPAPPAAEEEEEPPFHIEAKAALLIDPDTEEILYAQDIHEQLYPASVTKVLTCLLVLEAIDQGKLTMDTILTASETAISAVPPDGSNVDIKPGEELTVEELLYCIMLSSANEGCNMLAEAIDGSTPSWRG